MQLEYNVLGNSWVDIVSLTPINKVRSYYDGLNLIIENETYIVICFMNSCGNLETVEDTEYNFRGNIRVKQLN